MYATRGNASATAFSTHFLLCIHIGHLQNRHGTMRRQMLCQQVKKTTVERKRVATRVDQFEAWVTSSVAFGLWLRERAGNWCVATQGMAVAARHVAICPSACYEDVLHTRYVGIDAPQTLRAASRAASCWTALIRDTQIWHRAGFYAFALHRH
eukprot:SAG31_NODE_3044_length_4751_cov_29.695615_5_plen_153_part_00